MERKENQKFEFILKLNDNIVCQRYFSVKNYVNDSEKSLDLYECVSYVCEDIKEDLKSNTINVLSEYHNDEMSNITENEGNFTITVKKENRNIIERTFPANVYPPRVRYSVDIRPKISRYLREITDILSDKNNDRQYLNYEL